MTETKQGSPTPAAKSANEAKPPVGKSEQREPEPKEKGGQLSYLRDPSTIDGKLHWD